MENQRRVRNYFPEPRFQLKFLAFLVGGSVLQISATGGILYYFLNQNYELLVKYSDLSPEMTNLLMRELKFLVLAISSMFTLLLVGITFLGVMFSHRIAGPLYALKRTAAQIIEGKEVRLKLRKGDEFRELESNFNTMVDQLKQGGSPLRKVGA